MNILISAAETSSDGHGAHLLRVLRAAARQDGAELRAFGIGGPKLQAEGLEAIVDARQLLAMGLTEVVGRLPKVVEALRVVTAAAKARQPVVAVVIDYPEFHFKLAARLKRLGIPVIYYIPPKVWVWRRHRVKILKALFARILCILPFEEEFYRQAGVPVRYVGNPLIDELPAVPDRAGARRELGLSESEKVLVLMPGSRPAELRQHTELLLDAATEAAARMRSAGALGPQERLRILLPFPVTADLPSVRNRVERWRARYTTQPASFILDLRVSQGDAAACLAAADVGLIKSGTSTLEAGLAGLPHAIVYQASFLTRWVFKGIVRYRGPLGLVNLVAEPKGYRARPPYLIREILGKEADAHTLALETVSLFCDPGKRERIMTGLRGLRAKIQPGEAGSSPSQLAAEEVMAVIREAAKDKG